VMKAYGYVRVSTEEQSEEGKSLQAQEKSIREFAAKKGLELVKVFSETESAFRPGARKVFDEMIRSIEANPDIEAVVVWKVSRAARNRSDWATLVEKVRGGKGIFVMSVTEQMPPTSAGALMGDISAAFAFWQAKVISEQTMAGQQAWAEQGILPSRAPLGYINRPKQHPKQRGLGVEPHQDYAPHIARMFELFATGIYTTSDLQEYAEQHGIKTYYGQTPSKHQINDMLRNPFYYGMLRWKGRVYQGKHEPLISEALWRRVQEILEQRSNRKGKHKKKFPFMQLLSCGYCSSVVTACRVRGHGGSYVYYYCDRWRDRFCKRPMIRQEVLSDWLAEIFLPLRWPEQLKKDVYLLLKEMSAESKAWIQDEVTRLEHRRDELKAKISSGLDKYLEGKIPEELWVQKSREWQRELTAIEQRLDNYQNNHTEGYDAVRATIEKAATLYDVYLSLSDGFERDALVRKVVSNLKLTREKLDPVYRKPYSYIANFKPKEDWRPQGDSNPRFGLERAVT
jgi:site-specific DNA recombinase